MIGIIIVVFLLILAVYVVKNIKRQDLYDKEKEKIEDKQKEIFQKYRRDNNITENANVCYCTNINSIEGNWKVFIWKNDDILYICEATVDGNLKKVTIPIDNVNFYTRKGEVRNTTITEGGDISIENAIIGGMVGLFIGSILGFFILGGISAFVGLLAGVFLAGKRKITTFNQEIDDRKTYLNYLEDNKNKQVLFLSSDYKILYDLMPEKDISYIENNTIIESKDFIMSNKSDTVYKDIERLAELKDKGILTEEEFSQKKKVLLDKIS